MGAFRFHQYQVVGRALPTEKELQPKIYRMKLWATNEVRAKSKFWFIFGFLFGGFPWYLGAFIIMCTSVDHREKAGYVACAIDHKVLDNGGLVGETDDEEEKET